MTAAERALEEVREGMALGLGTGRAATAFIVALGDRLRTGLRIRGGVPTSDASADLAWQLGIPLLTLDDASELDLAIDGADEVDPHCHLIKGYGGALVREKVVAASAKRFIVLVGEEKLVSVLGQRHKLPVEVVPFALSFCRRRLEELGLPSDHRSRDGTPYITDNGNHILDCRCGPINDPDALDSAILAIPGIVGTGLFARMAHEVIIQRGAEIEVQQPR
ncbi:MAG: ribose-5-phosphate isomerase RpiA [Gemmataceae bacterium]